MAVAIGIIVVFLGVMAYLFSSLQEKKERVKALAHIPSFSVQTIDNKIFTQKDLPQGKKVLVYFHPECHYCQAEMEELAKINAQYPDIHWILFTDEPLEKIRKFAEQYQLTHQPNITWCNDPNSQVYLSFAMKSVPYFLGYNDENQLVFRNSGAVKSEKIISQFNESRKTNP